MSDASTNGNDPDIDRINLRIASSFLADVDETWKVEGFNTRSECIRYALRELVKHPEGAGFWKDAAIGEVQYQQGETMSSDEIKRRYDLRDE